MQGVRIRDARPDELETVGEIRVAAYLADGFLSADSAYEILGTVMICGWPGGELPQSADEAEVRALAVAPDARGLGIGRRLVGASIERARASGVRHLVLSSRTDMVRAQHLYVEAGFSRLTERDWAPMPEVNLLAFGLHLDAS
jgi:ribosomal protein S18 acetylase RimI-like enzyme